MTTGDSSETSSRQSSPYVFETVDADFDRDVLDRSKITPVLVDFWAPWCQPCRSLGPLLEKLAGEGEGRFTLAKINVDDNPETSERFQVSGIPAVFLIMDSKIAGQFTGFQPENVIQQFLDERLPSEADKIAERALGFTLQDPVGAERMYEQALLLNAEHGPSLAGLAELAASVGNASQARAFAERVERRSVAWDRARRVLAKVGFIESAASNAGLEELEAACRADPSNFTRRMALGSAYAGVDRYQEALETWVQVVEADRDFGHREVRPLMIEMFRLIGDSDALTSTYRQRLTSALY